MRTLSVDDIVADLRNLVASADGATPAAIVREGLVRLLERVRMDTWARVAEGDISRPATWSRALRPVLAQLRDDAPLREEAVHALRELELAMAALPAPAPAMRPAELTDTQREVMLVLARAPGRLARSQVRENSSALRALTLTAVDKALRKLEVLAMVQHDVERRQGASAARVWMLTPAGRELAREVEKARMVGMVDALVIDKLPRLSVKFPPITFDWSGGANKKSAKAREGRVVKVLESVITPATPFEGVAVTCDEER